MHFIELVQKFPKLVFWLWLRGVSLHNWRINSAADRPQAAAHCFNFSCSSSFNRTVIGTFRTSFSDVSLLIFLNPPVLNFIFNRVFRDVPWVSPHAFRLWIGLCASSDENAMLAWAFEEHRGHSGECKAFSAMADTIRCSLSLWTTPQSIFLCSRHSSIPVLPSEKKILCPFHLRSGFGFSWLLDKQKSRYTTSRMTGVFSPAQIRNAM